MDQETEAFKEQQAFYKIISFPAAKIPHGYRNLVYSSWAKSYKSGNKYLKFADRKSYHDLSKLVIDTYLTRPQSYINLAVLHEDNDVVLGWSLIDGDKLHYVYVKELQRKQGIGRALIKGFSIITHLTDQAIPIILKHYENVIYNPFA